MEELGRLLLDAGGMAYPSLAKIDLDFFDAAPTTGKLSTVAGPPPAAHSTGALLTRLRTIERKKVAIGAGGLMGLVVAFVVVGAFSSKGGGNAAAPVVAAPVVAAPVAPTPVVPAPVEPAEPVAAAPEEAAPELAPTPEKGAVPARSAKAMRLAAAAENKHLLAEGERLLRAEKFPEARKAFEKVSQSKHDRGPALVGLAEVAFQEKNYTQAARSAEQAAEHGGGVRARVLEGDAQFRLGHFKESAKAYSDALKLDPANASAKSGLALANKRM
jgi:Tetratricopeptide repeat